MDKSTPTYTQNNLLADAAGQKGLTAADKQQVHDFKTLTPENYTAKYGKASAADMIRQAVTASDLAKHMAASDVSRSPLEAASDLGRNLTTGAVSNVLGAGSFIAGLAGANTLAGGLAEASEGVSNWASENASVQDRARAQAFNILQASTEGINQRQYEEDKAAYGDGEATLRRLWREGSSTVSNALSSGHARAVAENAVGSVFSTGVMGAGAKLAAGGVIKGTSALLGRTAAVKAAENAAQGTSMFLNKVKNVYAPWAAGTFLGDGGDAYTSTLNEYSEAIKNKTVEELLASSPEFAVRYRNNLEAGMSLKDAEVKAKQDVLYSAAENAGLKAGAVSMLISPFTARAGKLLSGESKTAMGALRRGGMAPFYREGNKARQILADLTVEPAEETVTEGFGQYASNVAARDYIDSSIDPYKGVGESAALGFVGGFGMSGIKAGQMVGRDSVRAAASGVANGYEYAKDYVESKRGGMQIGSYEDAYKNASEIKEDFSTVSSDLSSAGLSAEAQDNISTSINAAQAALTEATDKDADGNFTLTADAALNSANIYGKTVSDLNGVESPSAKRVSTLGQQVLYQVNQTAQAKVADLRSRRAENAPMSAEQATWEATAIVTQSKIDPAKATAMYNSLSDADRQAVHSQINPTLNNSLTLAVQPSPKPTGSGNPPVPTGNPPPPSPPGPTGSGNPPTPGNPGSGPSGPSGSQNPPGSGTRFTSNKKQKVRRMFSESSMSLPDLLDTPGKDIREFYKTPDGYTAYTSAPEHIALQDYANHDFWVESKDGRIVPLPKGSGKHISEALVAAEKSFPGGKNPAAFMPAAVDTLLNEAALPFLEYTDSQTGKNISIDPYTKTATVDGKTKQLSEETINDLIDGISGNDALLEKTLNDIVDDSYDGTVRHAENLDPEALAKKNQYLDENGKIQDFDSDAVKTSFAQKFPTLSKLMTPVRRMLHLWNSGSSPIQALIDLATDPRPLFQANNSTNATYLANVLSEDGRPNKGKKGFLERFGSKEHSVDYAMPLKDQIRAILAKDSFFSKSFMEGFQKELKKWDKDKLPASVRELLFTPEGNLKPEAAELMQVVMCHSLAVLQTYPHEVTDEEITRLGGDIRLNHDRNLTDGVILEDSVNHMATFIRKFMGVADANQAKLGQLDEFYGFLATSLINVGLESGMFERDSFNLRGMEYDANAHERKVSNISVPVLRVTEAYHGLFQGKAEILLALVDPTMRNAYHTEPQPVDNNVTHSTEQLSDKAKSTLEVQNKMAMTLNEPMANILLKLGEIGICRLVCGDYADENTRSKYTKEAYRSLKGKQTSVALGFRAFYESVVGTGGLAKAAATNFFMDHMILKNGRIMEKGAATPQNNHLMRELFLFKNAPTLNLKGQKMYKDWTIVVASNLGIKVAKRSYDSYAKEVQSFIDFMGTHADTINNLIENPNVTPEEIIDTVKSIQKAAAEKFPGFNLKEAMGLNLMCELAKFHKAKNEGTLDHFSSNIYLEIDGQNDGPSFINALYAVAYAPFKDTWVKKSAQTGNHYGTDTTTQSVASKNSDASDIYDANGSDLHAETQHLVADALIKRIVAVNQRAAELAKNSASNETARQFKKFAGDLLNVLQAVGYIKVHSSVEEIINLSEIPKDLAQHLEVSRDISKILSTIIPYGSQTAGTTANIMGELCKEVNNLISSTLQPAEDGTIPSEFNGVGFETLIDSLESLMEHTYDKNTNSFVAKMETVEPGRGKQKPTYVALNALKRFLKAKQKAGNAPKGRIDFYAPNESVAEDIRTVQDFMISPDAFNNLTSIAMPIFGEPAQAAVTASLGRDGMNASNYLSSMGAVITAIAQCVERSLLAKSDFSRKDTTVAEAYRQGQTINKFSPTFRLPGGPTIVVRKTGYGKNSKDSYKNSVNGLTYSPNTSMIEASGASTAPLVTQGAGDATTAWSILQMCEQIGLNLGQVFDGMNVSADRLDDASRIANESSNFAQKQKILGTARKRVLYIGSQLKKAYPGVYKGLSDQEAFVKAVTYACSGKSILGLPLDLPKGVKNDLAYSVKRAIASANGLSEFEPDFIKDQKTRRSRRTELLARNEENLEKDIHDGVTAMLKGLDAMALNEDVNHKVLNKISKSTQHMSGGPTAFYSGKPYSPAAAKKFMKLINHIRESKGLPKLSFNEFLAAYLNARVQEELKKGIEANKKAKDPNSLYTDEIEAYRRELTGDTQGNSGIINLLSDEEMENARKFFEEGFPVKDTEKTAPPEPSAEPAQEGTPAPESTAETEAPSAEEPAKENDDFEPVPKKEPPRKDSSRSKTIRNPNVLRKAFRDLSAKYPKGHLFNAIYRRIESVLPKNAEITIVSDVKDLPEHIRKYFTNTKQVGLFVYSRKDDKGNRISEIFLIDQSKDKSLNIFDEKNVTNLVHEAIHAVFSSYASAYMASKNNSNDPKDVTSTEKVWANGAFTPYQKRHSDLIETKRLQVKHWQKDGLGEWHHAFENLEELINDFLDTVKEHPEYLTDNISKAFYDILTRTDGAQRLDEALAYILSNADLIKSLKDFKVKRLDYHRTKYGTLLKNILSTCEKLCGYILSIFTGGTPSRLERVYDAHFTEKYDDVPPLKFMQLFGANTLALTEALYNPTQPNKRLPPDLNRDITPLKALKFDSKEAEDPSRNFKEALSHKVARSYKSKAALALKKINNAKGIQAVKSEVEQHVARELEKISDLQTKLTDRARESLDNPEKFAQLVTQLMNPDVLSSDLRYELTKIYQNFKNALNFPKDLSKDPAMKKLKEVVDGDLLNFLMGSETPEYLSEDFKKPAAFFALAFSDPDVRKSLNTVKVPVPQRLKGKGNPDNSQEFLDALLERLQAQELHDKYDDKSADDIKDIVDDERGSLVYPREPMETSVEHFFRMLDNMLASLLKLPAKTANALGKPALASRFNSLSYAGESLKRNRSYEQYLKNVEELRSFFLKHLGVGVLDWAKDAYGVTLSSTKLQRLLKTIKGMEDKNRKFALETIPKALRKAFKKNLTKSTSRFLHKVIGTSGLGYLDPEVALECLGDPAKLDGKIHELEEHLANHTYTEKEWIAPYKQKIIQLANYLTGTRTTGHNLLTNAESIARLNGEDNAPMHVTEEAVRDIEQLISLYCLKNLSKEEMAKLNDLAVNEREAMSDIVHMMHYVYEIERKRTKDMEGYWKMNYLHGYLPDGTNPTGHYVIVPKEKEADLIKKGYRTLGDYKATDFDKSEPMVRMYCNSPLLASYQEGVIQGINKTAFGYQTAKGTRGEAYGTRILGNNVAFHLANNFDSIKGDNQVIPLYDQQGRFLGFERPIPPEDRELIESHRDLPSGIAQYLTRQKRETIASEMTHKAIDAIKEDWDSATKAQRRSEFIDIFHTDNEHIKAAVARLDIKDKEALRHAFGGNHCYIRKDEVWTCLGWRRMSVSDIWEGTFCLPKSAQKWIAATVDLLVPNGRGRYYATVGETWIKGGVTFAKDTIIIRSGTVAAINAISNMALLNIVSGMPFKEIYRYYKKILQDTSEYKRNVQDAYDLAYKLHTTKDPVIQKELAKKLEDTLMLIHNLPEYHLIKSGEYSTIAPKGVEYEEIDLVKQKVDDVLDTVANKLTNGPKLRSVLKEVLMTKGSRSYNFMSEFVNNGDWLAKAACTRWLMEKNNLDETNARNFASTLFVDFDQFTGPTRDWLNRVGLTWFMPYKFRMMAAALLSMAVNPARTLLGTALTNMIGIGGSPLTENVIYKTATGSITNAIGPHMAFSGIGMHPLSVVLSGIF